MSAKCQNVTGPNVRTLTPVQCQDVGARVFFSGKKFYKAFSKGGHNMEKWEITLATFFKAGGNENVLHRLGFANSCLGRTLDAWAEQNSLAALSPKSSFLPVMSRWSIPLGNFSESP